MKVTCPPLVLVLFFFAFSFRLFFLENPPAPKGEYQPIGRKYETGEGKQKVNVKVKGGKKKEKEKTLS
jgi:hypothetical protein